MSERFTEKAENALNRSVKIAQRLGHTYIGSEHLLLALAEDEVCCASLILKKNGIDKAKISSYIKEYSGTGVKSKLTSKDLTPRARNILENSYTNAEQYSAGTIGTEHILLSLIEESDSIAIKLMKNMKADLSSIKDDIFTLIKSREKTIQRVKKDALPPILKQYGKNLCELAKEGAFDPVIGRDLETSRLIRVLSRKNKNNPCLIGEAGVGKTAIVEGLAQKIIENDVPESLIGKTIISIDLTSMVAGAKYRGDFEDRIKNIINEVTKRRDLILFIDEIHTIVGAGAAEGAIDASNILKPQLARGDLQVIGATTYEEYRKYIERDAALERRFQPINVDEPSKEETVKMLFALKNRYEEHHGVKIHDDAIVECVELSSKYINDRFLPDKAIDILDEACAFISSKSVNILNSNINTKQFEQSGSDIFLDLYGIYGEEYKDKETTNTKFSVPEVTESVIKEVISEACGIPSSMVRKSTDYKALERNLGSIILGQDEAILKLVYAIRRSDLGLGKDERPRGIFLFVGESGVGKTALAIELEKNLFYTTSSLIRLDMSEYSEKQSISKLIGAPPGYVGHEDGGTLTEKVKRRQNSVILFDEIEKADSEIMNIILQIADYGYLSDSHGKKVSFRNTIIIATTNLGASNSTEKVGFESKNVNERHLDVISNLKKHYKEEFLNRFDEIIYFKPIDNITAAKIIRARLDQIKSSLFYKGYNITFSDEVIEHLLAKCNTRGFGARPILRKIKSEIEDGLIDMLLNEGEKTKQINVKISNGEIVIEEKAELKM